MRKKEDLPFVDIDQKPLPGYYQVVSNPESGGHVITLMVTDAPAPPIWEGTGSVPIDAERHNTWLVEVGKFLGRQIKATYPNSGIEDPEKCVLAALPTNYEIRRRMRRTGNTRDTYLRGSSYAHEFRTPYEFAIHARWLAAGAPMKEAGEPNCVCRYCGPYTQSALLEHFWDKAKKTQAKSSSTKVVSTDLVGANVTNSGRPKRSCAKRPIHIEITDESESISAPAPKRRRERGPEASVSVRSDPVVDTAVGAPVTLSEHPFPSNLNLTLEQAPDAASPPKRRRGRPRKLENLSPPNNSQNGNDSVATAPPPDITIVSSSTLAPTKRRGRPPKLKLQSVPLELQNAKVSTATAPVLASSTHPESGLWTAPKGQITC